LFSKIDNTAESALPRPADILLNWNCRAASRHNQLAFELPVA
jgi:hypothetical protein